MALGVAVASRGVTLGGAVASRGVALGVAVLALSCSSPRVVQTALKGNLPALQREIAAAAKAGELDQATVRELAEAVLGREIMSVHGTYAPGLVASFSKCAEPVLSAIEGRADAGKDDVAAAAQRLLLDLGELAPDDAIEMFSTSDSGAFRAVAAAATRAPEHARLRRAFLVDPDPRVREGALRAALAAKDAGDTEILFEGSRVDPEPTCRGLALRALGQMGTDRAVNTLRDRWVSSDETTQMSIAEAWSLPPSLARGGDRMLVWVAETADGLPAITAAVGLLRRPNKTRETGVAVLLRLLEHGTPTERRVVAQVAPLDAAPLVARMRTTSRTDADPSVRALALTRLLALPNDAPAAQRGLRALLPRNNEAARLAEQALAGHGDASVAPALVRRLQKGSVEQRRTAALALLELKRYSDVAVALADKHPKVRASVACGIVSKP